MWQVESDTIFTMEKRLANSRDRLSFLSEFAQFSPAEIRLNANVFMWHGRMPAIFEEHKLIISEKRSQYEDNLKVWACLNHCAVNNICLVLNKTNSSNKI